MEPFAALSSTMSINAGSRTFQSPPGMNSRTLASSWRGLNGFVMYPSQPAERALASSPLKA
jgi:hypothetical protein